VRFLCEFTPEELTVVRNCLNEVIRGLRGEGFEGAAGAGFRQVETLNGRFDSGVNSFEFSVEERKTLVKGILHFTGSDKEVATRLLASIRGEDGVMDADGELSSDASVNQSYFDNLR